MTANFYHIPYDILETISKRIVNEVAHINRVVYDITSKPPATIEWNSKVLQFYYSFYLNKMSNCNN